MFGKYENINYNYDIKIVTQDLVYNSILMVSLHLGRGIVSSVRMV